MGWRTGAHREDLVYMTVTGFFFRGFNLNNFQEYLIQHSLKSGGTKDHFRQVKVLGTVPY
jgi:hypothetical protein